MWQPAAPSPVEERNRALQRLRSWTTTCATLAAGLVVVFALLAANSFPGHSSDAAAASRAQTGPSSDDQGLQPVQDQAPPQQTEPQAPPQGFFGGGGGRMGAVSGGS